MESHQIDEQGSPSATSHNSLIGVWHGASNFGETGVVSMAGTLAFSVFEIPSVPDLSSPRFADFSRLDKTQRIAQMGERINKFLGTLHDLGPFCAVSLRYFFQPQANGDGKIRLFLIGRSFGQNSYVAEQGISKFRRSVERTFPHEYSFDDLQNLQPSNEILRKVLFLEGVQSIAELLKPEQTVEAWHEPQYAGFSKYYLPRFFEPSANDMIEFCRALIHETRGREAVVDVCLVPAAPLTEYERLELDRWRKICQKYERDFEVEHEIPGGLYSQPQKLKVKFDADPRARETGQAYEKLLERYGSAQNRYFLYAVRALWWHDEPPREIINSLASFALAAQNAPQPVSIRREFPHFQKALNAARFCFVSPTVCRGDIWESEERLETIRRLHRLADLKEISGFFRFPIAGHEGCPGIETDTGFQQSQELKPATEQIALGKYQGKNQFATVSLEELTKHALIVGMPGSGKTTLCFSILKQLWDRPHPVPFIVLEPAKTEYRGLKNLPCFRDDLLIFTVGRESVSPFRFNPFEVPNGIELSEHLSTLMTCFSGAFNLFDPLPMMLERALREIYEEKTWSEYSVGGKDKTLQAPILEDLYKRAVRIAESSSYKGETAGNIKGALESRLGSLLGGAKGRCFNTRLSVPFEMLMQKPIILELDALNDEQKALTMMFVLALVRAHAKTHQREHPGKLKHVVLVEEAHNVIGRGDAHSGGENRANPQVVSIRFFTRMLAELRAWGEGIIIADQLPTAIAPEASKQTNMKVMHRIVSADDRQELGSAMVFDSGQFEQAATLPTGGSFLFKGGEPRSQMISELNVKEEWEKAGFGIEPPDDFQIKETMQRFREQESVREVFLPYAVCKEVCRVCNPIIREQNERLVNKEWTKISAMANGFSQANADATSLYPHLFEQYNLSEPIQAGCFRVHCYRKISELTEEKTS